MLVNKSLKMTSIFSLSIWFWKYVRFSLIVGVSYTFSADDFYCEYERVASTSGICHESSDRGIRVTLCYIKFTVIGEENLAPAAPAPPITAMSLWAALAGGDNCTQWLKHNQRQHRTTTGHRLYSVYFTAEHGVPSYIKHTDAVRQHWNEMKWKNFTLI